MRSGDSSHPAGPTGKLRGAVPRHAGTPPLPPRRTPSGRPWRRDRGTVSESAIRALPPWSASGWYTECPWQCAFWTPRGPALAAPTALRRESPKAAGPSSMLTCDMHSGRNGRGLASFRLRIALPHPGGPGLTLLLALPQPQHGRLLSALPPPLLNPGLCLRITRVGAITHRHRPDDAGDAAAASEPHGEAKPLICLAYTDARRRRRDAEAWKGFQSSVTMDGALRAVGRCGRCWHQRMGHRVVVRYGGSI